ncbi:hypothetical protein pb186bvf_003862 [Paramecium bursaria]
MNFSIQSRLIQITVKQIKQKSVKKMKVQQQAKNNQTLRDLVIDLSDSQKSIHNCNICKKLALSPEFCIICQEIFCNQCVTQTTSDEKQQQQKCQHKTIQDNRTIRLQQQLVVKCQNSELGCQSTFIYSRLQNHLQNDCQYTLIQCSNIGCHQMYQKNDKQHKNNCQFQLYNCQFCKKQYKQSSSHDCYNDLLRTINQQTNQIAALEKKYQQLQNILQIRVTEDQVKQLIQSNESIQAQNIYKQLINQQDQAIDKKNKILQETIQQQIGNIQKECEQIKNGNKNEIQLIKDQLVGLQNNVEFYDAKIDKLSAKNSKQIQQIDDNITKIELVYKQSKKYNSTSLVEEELRKMTDKSVNLDNKKSNENCYFFPKTHR